MARLKIKQIRSASRHESSQQRTLYALGIRKNGRTVEHEATPQIRGMVAKIIHLLKVEETP
jgi:large subunit ribosomal protein L30